MKLPLLIEGVIPDIYKSSVFNLEVFSYYSTFAITIYVTNFPDSFPCLFFKYFYTKLTDFYMFSTFFYSIGGLKIRTKILFEEIK